MASVKVLIKGFTCADSKESGVDAGTRATISLVRDGDIIMIADPGVLNDQSEMVEALAKENLKVNDITHVFISHSHLDHYRNIGMFPTAKTIEYFGIWDGGKCDEYPEQFSKNIRIIKTPGHSIDGLTMIVNTAKGKIAIAGDLWWSERGPKNDPYAIDPKKLNDSREKILELADFIIPGHGEIFRSKSK